MQYQHYQQWKYTPHRTKKKMLWNSQHPNTLTSRISLLVQQDYNRQNTNSIDNYQIEAREKAIVTNLTNHIILYVKTKTTCIDCTIIW